jgi:hypothetical protein
LEADDNRAVALVGALVVENAIDGFLGAHIPAFRKLQENRDFTFSLKTELARALELCPHRLFDSANGIRQIRNDFAHDLSISAFAQCKKWKTIKSLRKTICTQYKRGSDDRTIFTELVWMVFYGLRTYTSHVELLNTYVRGKTDFYKHFVAYCKEQNAAK